VCRGTTFNFSTQTTPASASDFNTIAWTTTGSGAFTNTTTLTPSYVAGAAESGPITFTLTATGNGSCIAVTDQMVLNVTPQVVVNAGSNAETCQGVSINFGTRTTEASASGFNTLTWTGGAGTLVNANTLSPTYTPTAGETGVITFTLTATGNGSCATNTSTMQLTITPRPIVNAGSDQEVCRGTTFNFSTQTTPASASDFNTIAWTTTGSGTFTNTATLTPSYVAGAAESGPITFTLTATGNGSCTTVTDQMVLTVTPQVVVNAGSNAETCQGASINFGTRTTVASASGFNTLTWTGGAGILVNANTLSPTYTPTAGETGVVTFTLTATGNGSCATNTSTMQLTITPKPIVNAGSDQEVCRGTTFNFSTQTTPASASDFNTIAWTTTGSGTFTNTTTLTPSYVAGAAESGPITFTLTATGNGSCVTITDQMVLTVSPDPLANAGSNEEICQGDLFNFSTQSAPASVSNFSSLLWTHNGAGTLLSANSILPVYQAAPAETGVLTFTLTVNGLGSCLPIVRTMLLTIRPSVSVNAGTNAETCQGVTFDLATRFIAATATNFTTLLWTHTGTGALANATTLSPIYVPGVGETGNVTFTLTANGIGVCPSKQSQMTLTITPLVTVDAGSNLQICQGSNINFATQTTLALATNFTSVLWTHTGAGSLFNTSTLTPTYFASPTETGNVTFTLRAFSIGSCVSVTDVTTLNIVPAPLTNAGGDAEVCEGSPTFNFGARAIPASSANGTILWTHNGAGTLSNNALINPVYTLSPLDFGNQVTFTLTITSGAAVCSPVQDQFILKVNRKAIVSLPPNYTVCEASVIPLTGNIGGTATTALWTIITGGGTLSASNVAGLTVTSNYNVSPADIGTTVTFRLTSNDPDGPTSPCTTEFADINVTINRATSISAGIDLAQCSNQTSIALQGVTTYAPAGVSWSGGLGSFVSGSSPTGSYSFSNPLEISSTTPVTLTLTGNDPDGAGPCTAVTDQMRLTINPLPVVAFFGLPSVLAENNPTITLSGNQSGGLFTISPVTSNIGSTIQSPILDRASFDPSAVTLGSNTVTYSFTDSKGCTNSSSQGIIINPVTTINWTIDASKGAKTVPNSTGNSIEWELCGNQGDVQLFGSPPATGPAGVGIFSSGPGLSYGNGLTVFQRGPDYFIDTNGAVSDTYLIKYTFTNTLGATTELSYNLNLFAKPNAIITTPPNNCVESTISFSQASGIPPTPFSATIDIYQWRFGDSKNGTSTIASPSYKYDTPGTYNVSLTVTTNKGCSGSTTIPIRAGDVPLPNFAWSSICTNAVTQFVDRTTKVQGTTPSGLSNIIGYTWNFGDLTPPLTGIGPTFKNPTHVYATPGLKTVRLRVDTDDGCNAFIDQTITILNAGPTVTPSLTTPYKNNFDVPDLDWFREAKVISNPNVVPIVYGVNSWLQGTPSGSTIASTAGGVGAWWTGEKIIADQSANIARPTYYGNEVSWVNGPCFDLRQLNRPMVALDYWSDAESNSDGAVLQYSVDGGLTWEIVGPIKTLPAKDRDQGINWYDKDAVIQSNPGQQLANGPFGWTGKSGKWKNARFNLDIVEPVSKRNQVRVRVAFSSNPGNPQGSTDPNFDGFAFDNFFIGEKERIVLLEHFTNSSLVGSVAADAYLSNLYNNEISLPGRGGSDFNDIQYHVGFGSANSDPLNADNPNDPNARASSYGVSQPPKTFVDGLKNQKLDGTTTKLTNVEIDRRALKAPKFKLKLDTTATTGANRENFINVRLTMVADTIVNTPLIAQVALVEDDVVTPAGTFKNVLRKLLFGSDPTKPDGITITQTFTVGQPAVRPAQPAPDVEINVPISKPNNLKLIGFVQDKNTGEIYQSTIMKVKRKVGSVVVGLEDDPLKVTNLKDLQIFPNPANGKFNFGYPGSFPDGYIWKIADQRGIFVLTGDFAGAVNGIKSIDVSMLASGVYYVLIGAEGKVPVYRKLVVMN
jgi:PKD repeat protein